MSSKEATELANEKRRTRACDLMIRQPQIEESITEAAKRGDRNAKCVVVFCIFEVQGIFFDAPHYTESTSRPYPTSGENIAGVLDALAYYGYSSKAKMIEKKGKHVGAYYHFEVTIEIP